MIVNLLGRTIMMSTPLLLGALGEVIAERAGMMITAVEGIFIVGAWGGFVGYYLTGSPTAGVFAAMACGLFVAAIYGVITIFMRQHQVVTGTALNILAAGFCTYFQRVVFGVPLTPLKVTPLAKLSFPFLNGIPVIGPIFFEQNVLTYFAYLMIPAAYLLIFKTSAGLTIRSTGENPQAVDVAGIGVNKVRMLVVLLAGALGGVAGAFYSVGYLGMFTSNMIGGRGWIAFAICFLGNWNPRGVVIGTMAFGFAEAVGIFMQSSGTRGYFPNELFIALPYILTVALTVARRNFNVPAQLGMPYCKES